LSCVLALGEAHLAIRGSPRGLFADCSNLV